MTTDRSSSDLKRYWKDYLNQHFHVIYIFFFLLLRALRVLSKGNWYSCNPGFFNTHKRSALCFDVCWATGKPRCQQHGRVWVSSWRERALRGVLCQQHTQSKDQGHTPVPLHPWWGWLGSLSASHTWVHSVPSLLPGWTPIISTERGQQAWPRQCRFNIP